MRRLIFVLAVVCIAACLGCGARESHWGEAAGLQKEGKWAEAVQVYTDLINTTDNERTLTGAYLYRGNANMQAGNLVDAYRDLLVGKTMSCWITDHDSGYVDSSVGYLAMSEACQTYAPKRLAALNKKLSPEQFQQAKTAAQALIPEKYKNP